METSLKVAFASSDGKNVDQHFGAAESFTVYSLDRDRVSLLETIRLDRPAMDGNEDKLAPRVGCLQGCIAVYCQAIGASAIAQLRAQGIRAIGVSPGCAIEGLLAVLQEELAEGPPSVWLARAIGQRQSAGRLHFDEMEQEGWVE